MQSAGITQAIQNERFGMQNPCASRMRTAETRFAAGYYSGLRTGVRLSENARFRAARPAAAGSGHRGAASGGCGLEQGSVLRSSPPR